MRSAVLHKIPTTSHSLHEKYSNRHGQGPVMACRVRDVLRTSRTSTSATALKFSVVLFHGESMFAVRVHLFHWFMEDMCPPCCHTSTPPRPELVDRSVACGRTGYRAAASCQFSISCFIARPKKSKDASRCRLGFDQLNIVEIIIPYFRHP